MKKVTKKKIILATFIYIFASISFLAPFIAIEGSSKTLGFIVVGILTLAYLLFLLACFWDWYKDK